MAKSSFECLHSTITGAEAHEVLMKEGQDGSYLLRPSSSGQDDYSLSVRRGDEVIHIKIQNTGDYYDLFGGEMFANLPQLIAYYSTGEGKDHLKEKSGRPIRLKTPLCAPKHRSERWFHSNLSSAMAEKELEKIGKEGVFLVRESRSKVGDFVLSYFTGKDVIHVFIRKEMGCYTIGDGVNSFGSLSALVDHYREHQLTVKHDNDNYSFKLEKSLLGGMIELSQLDSKIHELEGTFTVKNKSKNGFTEEFEYIQQFDKQDGKPMSAGQLPENKLKNRYRNILPYDETRVVLKSSSATATLSDYINANYIRTTPDLATAPKVFIATQGCVKASVSDFWSMVWQEKVAIIIMTTELIENGKNKCYPYWPDSTEESLPLLTHQGALEVRLLACDQRKDYAVRTFEVLCHGALRTVYQYHYQRWPDRCAPKEVSGVVEFLMEVNDHSRRLNQPPDVPWVVHCSAGIGRTGTFILLDILINHILNKGLDSHVSILRLLIMMRTQRAGLVQLDKQYAFVYKALQLFLNEFYKKNTSKREGAEETNAKSSICHADSVSSNSGVYQNL